MAAITLRSFSGEIPNLQPYMLPQPNGQLASLCDFAQKDLRPLKQPTLYATMSNNVKGIYTEDGTKFMTWPIVTQAVKSPVINDVYNRIYFTNANGLKVTTLDQATTTGGEPAVSYNVGVPVPTAAPVLTTVDRTSMRDHPSMTVAAHFWYEYNGARYQEQDIASITEVTKFKSYSFAIPAIAAGSTPSGAVAKCEFKFLDGATAILDVILTANDTPTLTEAFPGGQELNWAVQGTLATTVNIAWGTYETRAYLYTVTNQWLEEGGPSPAAVIDVTWLQDVQVVTTTPSFTGYKPYSSTTIYRTFGSSANYVEVNASNTTGTTYLDTSYKTSDIGAGLYTLDFAPPPTGLLGIVAHPDGFLAAYTANQVYMCEPFRPHSWQYVKSFPRPIRAIHMAPQAIIVSTDSGVSLLVGNSPDSVNVYDLSTPQAAVSNTAVTKIEGAIAMATNDGILLVTGNQSSMDVSQQFFSRDDWRSRYASVLSTMSLAYHDGFLVATSPTGVGFIVRMDEATGTLTEFNVPVDATFYLPVLDTLYYSVGPNIYRFRDSSTYYTLDWWSKDFLHPAFVSYGALYIRCNAPVTVTVYADDAQLTQFTAPATGYYRLPSGKALRWSVRVQTTAPIEEISLASTLRELRSV